MKFELTPAQKRICKKMQISENDFRKYMSRNEDDIVGKYNKGDKKNDH